MCCTFNKIIIQCYLDKHKLNEFFENNKVRQKSLISFDFKSNIEITSGNVIELFILYTSWLVIRVQCFPLMSCIHACNGSTLHHGSSCFGFFFSPSCIWCNNGHLSHFFKKVSSLDEWISDVKQQLVIDIISMNLGVLWVVSVVGCLKWMKWFASSLVHHIEYDCMGENWWRML